MLITFNRKEEMVKLLNKLTAFTTTTTLLLSTTPRPPTRPSYFLAISCVCMCVCVEQPGMGYATPVLFQNKLKLKIQRGYNIIN